ncbi:MAG: CHAT domain-containing protein, partial [Nitrospirota bacterium]|nr:CHAT domain-containing protein [Nitrospirota bacterium]
LMERRLSEITEDSYEKRALDMDRPVVYVLPGTMGSHLTVGKDRVWLDKWDLAMGGLKKLKMTAKNVVAEKPIGSGYKAFMRYLSHSHQVIPFPYDWRKSLIELADALRRSLETTLNALPPEQPVRIVAHSMGGLVVRVMLATPEGKQVWDRMCQRPGARFIMLGTPNGGSHAITAMLMGRDPLVQQLDWLDLTNSQTTLLEIISRFDGVLQLLPHRGSLDVFNPEDWKKLRHHDRQDERGAFFAKVASSKSAGIYWPQPDTAQLIEAKRVTTLIQQSPIDPARMIYVAGRAAATPEDICIDPSGKRDRQVLVRTTSSGDGRVPWATGIPSELNNKTYYVDCEHGDLANFQESFEGLADLLHNGATTKLSKTPPARRGVVVVPQAEMSLSEMYDGRVEMYPDEDDLIAAALGSSRVRRAKPLKPKVKVRVINDNLSRASSPVVVGHYAGDTIVSAEGYLDGQLQGRLRERLRMGLYPDKLNSSAVFLNDGATQGVGRHPGAIVVGLGMVGELTPGGLTSTMADALANYALKCLEAERKRRQAASEGQPVNWTLIIPVTTLLVGTTGGGLTLADSLQSVLRGVLQANRRLELLESSDVETSKGDESSETSLKVFIDSVDVVELHQDRAIQAAKALVELGRSQDFREHLQIKETMVQGAEGQSRAYYAEAQDWWQRLRITTQKDGALKFEALTNRARAEVYLQPTQRKLIERFLARAGSSAQTNLDVSSTLFELLIPNRMKDYAPDHRDMVLLLDEESAAYPWELLNNRYDPDTRPLAVEAGMIRQLTVQQSQFREKVLHGTALNALVIGDPTSEESAGAFPPLPGAAVEARDVAQLIRQNGYREVVELVQGDASPEAVLGALYQQSYRILHCAAHGVFEYPLEEETDGAEHQPARASAKKDPCPKPKTVSGMVLGKGLFLTPAEIEQMRFVPELVFLNCCYLGKTKAQEDSSTVLFHRLASNLGTQLIRMGVRAVIAAGWAVDDQAANVFARKFYEEMFRNRPFGDAVKLARQEIFAQYGTSNTWGAYQCYGDPDYSFKASPKTVREEDRIVASAELLVALQQVARKAKMAKPQDVAWLRQKLDELKADAEPGWMESSAICAAFGKAYGELGLFEEAVHFYDKGRTLQPADATIESLEQLANLKVRWALKRVLVENKKDTKDKGTEQGYSILELFNDAETILDSLIKIYPTQERYALKGKIYKGKAILQKSVQALQDMQKWYGKGYDLGKKDKRNDLYYPLVNRLAAEVVLSWEPPKTQGAKTKRGKAKGSDSIAEGLLELEGYADVLRQKGQSFWDWSLKSDCLLLKALYAQSFTTEDREAILKGYQEAKRREGSAKDIDSVVENIRFLEAMLGTKNLSKARSSLAESLKDLRESLEVPGEIND